MQLTATSNRLPVSAWLPLLLLILAVGIGWLAPGQLQPLRPLIIPILGLIMLAMGMSLELQQFIQVLTRPAWLVLGLSLQYLLMPLAAWAIAQLLGLSPLLMAGLILTGSCPGGMASNVMVYLARGNLALSVALTLCSTLLAPLLTPLLTLWLAGKEIDVPALAMFRSILMIVIGPLLCGMLLRTYLSKLVSRLQPLLPGSSMFGVALIVAIIVSLNHQRLGQIGPWLLLAVALHNLIGLLGGYFGAQLFGAGVAERRTIAIEVGMQNSGLATALAIQFFPPLTALPAALFSVWHNLSGLACALIWRRNQNLEPEFGSDSDSGSEPSLS